MAISSTKAGPQPSLHDVMNALVRDEPYLVPARPLSMPALEEALVMLDPLLAGLQKQMLNATADYERVRTKHGKNDFISHIASDRLDSARCAFQTRLLELKSQRHVLIEARALMRETAEAADIARRNRALACLQRWKLAMDEECARIFDRKKRAKKAEDNYYFYMLFWLVLCSPIPDNVWNLSRRFSNVSALTEAA